MLIYPSAQSAAGPDVVVAGTSSLTIGSTGVVADYLGGARVPTVRINTDLALGTQHQVVLVDTSSGPINVTLPPGTQGRLIVIQRVAGSNPVNVLRNGSDTIQAGGTTGLTSWSVADSARHALVFTAANTEWAAES